MPREKTLPIEWEEWDQAGDNDLMFIGVTFLEDFGPWKKDARINCLCLELSNARLYEIDADGKESNVASIRIEVVR